MQAKQKSIQKIIQKTKETLGGTTIMENFIEEMVNQGARIKVIGAGGGGSNAIDHMIDDVQGVDFCIMNTDIQAIQKSKAPEKVQLGVKLTRGLGAGADPQVGRRAAEESIEEIKAALEGYDLVFVATGLGGGSGTGAAPVIAETAREMGILTVGVVTIPFGFEGRPRMRKAIEGKRELSQHVDTIITIPNDRLTALLKSQGRRMVMKKAFEEVNNVLRHAVQGITDLITKPGLINLDFADIKTIMSIRGSSLMGMGHGQGEDRIRIATEMAMKNPLLEHGIHGARGIIFNITGNENLDYEDFVLANELITEHVDEDCEIIVGTVLDESIPEDTVSVTVVATGFDEEEIEKQKTNRNRRPQTQSRDNAYRQPFSNQEMETNYRREVQLNKEEEEEKYFQENYRSQDEEEYVTKEMNSIFDSLDMPEFMKRKFGRN